MAFFDSLPLASFIGKSFPVYEIRVMGGLRDHDHEFPYMPASSPEKMGRRPYQIMMSCPFHDTFKKYPNLYPQQLDTLRGFFEQQASGALVIPTIGTINAYARHWQQTATYRHRSGETAEFLFAEDQSQLFLTDELFASAASNMTTKKSDFDAAAALSKFQAPATPDLLAAFDNAVNAVLAIQDTAEAMSNLMATRLARMVQAAQALDASADFQNPVNWPVVSVLHDLWDQAQTQLQNLQQTQVKPLTYTVKVKSSVTQISIAIYGDSSHAMDILQLNPIVDAFAVPAGSSILYYPANAQAA